MCKEMTWLNVTGCPRSGTTALGSALNKSKSIAVLHEHYPKDFFDTLELLFKNQDFHTSLGGYPMFADSIIVRERDLLPIVNAIFSIVFGKAPAVIGSKFPGLQMWEKTTYPPGVALREINIIRNPVDVVNSYVAKTDGTLSGDAENAFCDWLNSFNYAISQRDNGDFLWLLYEEFRLNENQAIAKRVADFLKVEQDFDLAEMASSGKKAEPNFLENNSGQVVLDVITELFDVENWVDDAAEKIAAGCLVGYPLPSSGKIDMTATGNSWKYVFKGFYPAEDDGSWTKGEVGTICFTPEKNISGRLYTTLDISWSLGIHDAGTTFSIYLDDVLIGKTTLTLGASNGGSNLVIFDSPEFVQRSKSVTLRVVVGNPRNPAALGISDDNRDLGIMIRSISFAH
ncbi:hypothetical protein PSAKL28_52540 [Pseudomonas alkylphenolica]|uniref:Sulfotransferase domain-containing protein n=1 Tax=Pseudomonas alkylphenolica TaxID=237609 RepID=A0A077FJW4_9PSED|nr:hypothetical protein PSAKL28_52540 [Pseudomonas alkylphenolica]